MISSEFNENEASRTVAVLRHSNEELRRKLRDSSSTNRRLISQNAEMQNEIIKMKNFIKKITKSIREWS